MKDGARRARHEAYRRCIRRTGRSAGGRTPQPEPATPDTGLLCLAMLARYHQVAADPDQLAHEFRADGAPFGVTEILLAARKLDLRARRAKVRVDRLTTTPCRPPSVVTAKAISSSWRASMPARR